MGRWVSWVAVAVLCVGFGLGGCISVDRADPDEQCVPECSGRECGDDGCGGSCGTCESGLVCSEGSCEDAGIERCLDVAPASIDFGQVAVGEQHTRTLELEACSPSAVGIEQVRIADSGAGMLSLDLSGLPGLGSDDGQLTIEDPMVILAGGSSATITVRLDASAPVPRDEQGLIEGAVQLTTDAAPAERNIPVKARVGTAPPPGPKAVIDVAEGAQVETDTVLHLDGSESSAPGGVAAWRWSFTGPEGADASFQPSAMLATPSLVVDTPGVWTIRLEVEGSGGGTDTASVSVEVFDVSDLYAVLEWDAPGDGDPDDIFGADVNLHLVHSDAGSGDTNGDGLLDGWFDLAWACWADNSNPDWGSTGNFDDDPYWTEEDDKEEIYLEVPESGVTYRVGVHYFADDGFDPVGEVFATVRVYSGETLLLEQPNIGLDLHDFWEVGAVSFPSAEAESFDDGGSGPRIISGVSAFPGLP
ncbi:MAG: hypothetical protein ACQEXJ_22850 [Myxococcota bacterium]